MTKPDAIYYGKRTAMQGEVGTLDCYDGKFLVQPIGSADWDAEGFRNITEARREARALAATYGVKAVLVS